MYDEQQFKEKILHLSTSKIWKIAIHEWKRDGVTYGNKHTCLCGHTPIHRLQHVLNVTNGNRAMVGGICIGFFDEKLLVTDAYEISDSLLIIKSFRLQSASLRLIDYAYGKKLFDDADLNFYLNVRGTAPEDLSIHQQVWKRNLNTRLLNHAMEGANK